MTKPLKYAVLGYPVNHSKSPAIHHIFAQQFGISINYSAIEIKSENFKPQLHQLIKQGYQGFNITLPHKEKAFALSEKLDENANIAQAVNTIAIRQDKTNNNIYGYNTDGIGLVKALSEKTNLSNKNLLILGAGGAVKGIIAPLINAGVKNILIANRTVQKAQQLSLQFNNRLTNIVGSGLDDAQIDQSFDIIINGTSGSVNNEIPVIPAKTIGKHTIVMDMMYSVKDTTFCQWAKTHIDNIDKVIDGRGMLIMQAAYAFKIWFGKFPQTQPIFQQFNQL